MLLTPVDVFFHSVICCQLSPRSMTAGVCFICRITRCGRHQSLSAFSHACHTKLGHITTSNVTCTWILNFLNSNLGSILHKTKSFSKKTTLKSQNMISEIGRSKNSLYRFVMMTSPIINRNKLALVAASSQPLTLHH